MSDLLYEGLQLAVFGMGTVFTFLTLLVMVTTLMSKIIMAMEPAVVVAGAGTDGLDGSDDDFADPNTWGSDID